MRALFALLLAAAACSPTARRAAPNETVQESSSRRMLAERVVSGWADQARLAARALIAKYGAPDQVRSTRLEWGARGRWKKTTVRDLPLPYSGARTTELGVLEQTAVHPLRGDLTVRSDSEAVNFLRLNLADEVIRGRLTEEQARAAEASIRALEAAGKTTGYSSGLRF